MFNHLLKVNIQLYTIFTQEARSASIHLTFNQIMALLQQAINTNMFDIQVFDFISLTEIDTLTMSSN